jgi:hypothetical protein
VRVGRFGTATTEPQSARALSLRGAGGRPGL